MRDPIEARDGGLFAAPSALDPSPGAPSLARELERLDRLVDWERRPRASSTQGSGMRVSVEPARDLLRRLGSPERGLAVVHVAGTKGKGSVASLVHCALARAGTRTGCYASPHVERVNERVRIDGAEIGDGALARVLGLAQDALEAARAEGTAATAATWFDVLTAAAVLAFRDAGVELAVVECGLGGRLDSTNALDGLVCVVTNVDLEHTEVLGGTRAAIAAEKAGILKPGALLVTGLEADDEAGRVVAARAAELGVPVRRPEPSGSIAERNARTAALVLDALGERGIAAADGRPVSADLLDEAALRAARLPGRLDLRRTARGVVALDGAHVPSSLLAALEHFEREGLRPPAAACVLGLGRDKDLSGLLKVLRGRVDRVLCTSVGAGTARDPGEIRDAARRAGLAAETAVAPRMALHRGLELSGARGWVLVTGSLHLIGAITPHLSEDPRC